MHFVKLITLIFKNKEREKLILFKISKTEMVYVFLEKTLNTTFYGYFCMLWKTSTSICFTIVYIREKNMKKPNANKWTWYCLYLQKWVWVAIAICLTSTMLPHESGG